MNDDTDIFDGVEVPIREVAGGYVGAGSSKARLDAIEERLDALRESWASLEAPVARVREAQAAAAAQADRRYRETIFGRPRVNAAEVGRALGDSLLGGTAPVRESVHPLGKVISGPHSHGAVRHTHDRLPGDHLHCPTCGSDTRLCLESGHYEPGATPARESNTQRDPNPFVAAMNAIYDGETSPITPGQAMAQVWRLQHAQGRTGQSGKDDGAAWEQAIFGR